MKKISNIKNVAEVAGVSISTVSRVLNHSAGVSEDLKDRVFKAIEETQYTINPIASNLKSARRNQIAIVLPSLKQTYFTDIIKGVSDRCYERQITPIILESSGEVEKEMELVFNLERQWVDGIILIPGMNRDDGPYREYAGSLSRLCKKKNQIPVVLAESNDLNQNLDSVRVDYENVFYKMAFHLTEIGRKHIAYLSSPEYAPLYDYCMSGVTGALKENGCCLKQNLVECGNYTVLDGYHSMNCLLDQGAVIDGVICSNDQVASGALHACKEHGINIPREVAVIGFGGVALSIITTPSITTMISPRYELGSKAAKLLFDRIEGYEGEARHVLMPAHLAIRESTLKTATKKMNALFAE